MFSKFALATAVGGGKRGSGLTNERRDDGAALPRTQWRDDRAAGV